MRLNALAILCFGIAAGRADGQIADSDSTGSSGFTVAPLPIIFYTPETKTAIGAALNIFYRPADADEDTRPSTFTPIFIYTFKSQVITAIEGNHYWDEEKNNVAASVSYINFPDSFYGIGNDVTADNPEDYASETYGAGVDFLRRVRNQLRIGVGIDGGRSNMLERKVDGILEENTIPGSEGGAVVGLSATLDHDSRDHITYPQAGGWTRLQFRIFDAAFGSDFDFRALSLDSRRYFSLGSERVIALRALVAHRDGQTPFQLLPSLGGSSLLRGYFGGRFRDQELTAVEAEFRRSIWRRVGVAIFAGIGQVADSISHYNIGAFHPAAGIGLRIRFIKSEKLNLRFDFGWGEDDSGSYISLGEAF